VVAIILIIAAIAIPNLLRSKMAANEASAVSSLRTLNTVFVEYQNTYGTLPSSLTNLAPSTTPSSTAADLVDNLLSTAPAIKSGYTVSYTNGGGTPITTYTMVANPVSSATGQKHFFTDQSGVIRYNTQAAATVSDSPIGN
jgi:type IV pilus assembly protein PilA